MAFNTDDGYTSLQLGLSLSLHSCTSDYLGDITGANNIPPPKSYPTFHIVNSSTTPEVTGHWILLYLHSPLTVIEYFDPLCKPPSQHSHHIQSYLQTFSPRGYLTNTFRVQPPESYNCGLYCCFVADKRCQGILLRDIMNMFHSKDLDDNETIVSQYYRNHILGL